MSGIQIALEDIEARLQLLEQSCTTEIRAHYQLLESVSSRLQQVFSVCQQTTTLMPHERLFPDFHQNVSWSDVQM